MLGLVAPPLLLDKVKGHWAGLLANAGVAEKRFSESYSQDHVLQPVLVKAALSVSAVGPVPSSRRSELREGKD